MNSIKDKVILITGASSGFGMVTAEKCVSLGAKVVLGARRNDRLAELCSKLGNDNAIFHARSGQCNFPCKVMTTQFSAQGNRNVIFLYQGITM